jgi:putative glutamine amidotransferase
VTATTEIIRGVLRVRANAAYTDSLHEAGMRPFILPLLDADEADSMLEGMQGLLLTGGEDLDPRHYGAVAHPTVSDIHAQRDAFELALVRAAFARRLPTLAICRGIQVANVALGGTLIQDIPSEHRHALEHDGEWPRSQRVHDVSVVPHSRLAHSLGATVLQANSFHHQALDKLGDGLIAVAHAPDGIVEGAEWEGDDWWMVGVQWHLEELIASPEPWDRNLFAAFRAAIALDVNSNAASAIRS